LSCLTPHEPLILFHVGTALAEGRDIKDAVQGWWKINHVRASTYDLVLAKSSNRIVGAFRPSPGSWHQRDDGRWGFASVYAYDVWDDYVGKTVPKRYRNQAPFQYLEP